MSENFKLEKKLPISHRNPFWTSLTKSVEDEIHTMKSEIDKKKTLISYRGADLDQLLDLVSAFLILPRETFEGIRDVLVDDFGFPEEYITFFLKQELYKLPFNFVNKATYVFYKSMFNVFGFSFDSQISAYYLFRQDSPLFSKVIARDIYNILTGVEESIASYIFIDEEDEMLVDDYGTLGYVGSRPVLHTQQSKENFTGIEQFISLLDLGEFVETAVNPTHKYSESAGGFIPVPPEDDPTHIWDGLTMDTDLLLVPPDISPITTTKHLAFEIELKDTVLKQQDYMLLPFEIIQYIYASAYFYKRLVEVPHVGAQMTLVVDNSGLWDTHSDEVLLTDTQGNPFIIVPYHDFRIDLVWLKGEGWEIRGGQARYTNIIEDPLVVSEPISAPFILQNIPPKTQFRISIDIDSIDPHSIAPGTEFIGIVTNIMDGDTPSETMIATFSEAGIYTFEYVWEEEEFPEGTALGVGIVTNTKTSINSLSVIPFERYSIPSAKVKVSQKQGIADEVIDHIAYVEFGEGEQLLPSRDDIVYDFPEELAQPLAKIKPLRYGDIGIEVWESIPGSEPAYWGVIGEYIGNMVNEMVEPISEFDVFDDSWDLEATLPAKVMPFRRGSLILGIQNLDDPSGEPVAEIRDDGSGRLSNSIDITGEINYSTGEILLETTNTSGYGQDGHNYGLIVLRAYRVQPTTIREAGVWGFTEAQPNELQLLAYATFAPLELFSNALHFNLGFILEK